MASLVTEHISFSVCQIILLESKFHKPKQSTKASKVPREDRRNGGNLQILKSMSPVQTSMIRFFGNIQTKI